MRSWMVKIGKTVGVLKHEGLVSSGKKIWSALRTILIKVRPGDILFISGSGSSALYRAQHVAEELEFQGFKCSITNQDSRYLLSYVGQFRIFIFHRTLVTARIEKFIGKLKEAGREIIFETDDLIFDPQYSGRIEYLKGASTFEKEAYARGIGSEILNDPYVKVATTSTAFLAEKLKARGKRVFTVPNKLSKEDLKIAEDTIGKKQKSQISNLKSQILLGYFSGTASHDKDFASITDVLIPILEKHSQVRMLLVGPLKIDERFEKFEKRIFRLPFISSRRKYFEKISAADITLAPLEKNNPFCEAKSELKWFEAGIVAVPTVASATRTFREAIRDGVDGFVPDTLEEWTAKLEKLIEDGELRRNMGEAARKTALERYSTQNAKNDEYYNYLRGLIK